MGLRITHKGDWNKTDKFLKKMKDRKFLNNLLKTYGPMGVAALSAATPRDTGATAASWSAEIESTGSGITIWWVNSHTNQSVNIALILQYGHGTGTGGYVSGIDYINPALAPVFDQIAAAIWKEVVA